MDFTTIVGIAAGILIIANGISMEYIGNFIDQKSLLIVVGGTLAAVMASYPPSILLDIPKHMRVVVRGNKYKIPPLVEELVDLTVAARKDGLLGLEDKAYMVKDPFLKQGLLMIIDADDADKVRYVMERELENIMVRHDQAAGLYEKASAYAPAFGMVGTLIGLVNMLKQLDMSVASASMGEDMSVALVTTFYGCMMANLIFHPIAKKLRVRQDEEEVYCTTIIEGIIAIQEGESPKYLREHLLTSVKQSQQIKILAQVERSGRTAGRQEEGEEEKGLYGGKKKNRW